MIRAAIGRLVPRGLLPRSLPPHSLPPHSLLGQVMLALAIGLVVGQAISAVLLYRAAEQRREIALVNSVALQLAMSGQLVDTGMPGRESHVLLRERVRAEHRAWLVPGGRIRIEQSPGFALQQGEERIADMERHLHEVLNGQGIPAHQILVTRRLARDDAFLLSRAKMQTRLRQAGRHERAIIVAGVQSEAGGPWQVVRAPYPRAPSGLLASILLQTLVTFAVLFLLLFLLLRRITRPLAQLTWSVERFARHPGQPIAMEASGPQDIRALIEAHNAMAARIGAMLDEKDVMLGAIGHDLKTPLAALRVRIESVEDADERARMAQGIADMAATLDDILSLARVGRPSDPIELTELSALVAGVVEEYEDMGEAVTLQTGERIALPLRATWIRRSLRNLIGNALRYGECATVNVLRMGDMAVVRIDDEGPGIPEALIAGMLEPFQRGEASRNRATGGAGLGLTLARAIAEQHGGSLVLVNRSEGGLRAELRFPIF